MEQLKAFFEKAKTDKELGEKLNALGMKGAGIDEYIALAAENGFTITAENLDEWKSSELSEKQLEKVAGGDDLDGPKPVRNYCFYQPKGDYRISDGSYWRECGAFSCGGMYSVCSCHGTPYCVKSWHRLEKKEGSIDRPYDYYLYPKDEKNHWQKAPFTYNT